MYQVWGWFSPLVALPLWTFFVLRTVWSIWTSEWAGIALFGGLALFVWLLHAGLFRGLLDIVRSRVRQMDILVEDNGTGAAAGVLIGRERWYLFLDGIVSIERCRDVWIVRHHSGHILWIPASAISDQQIETLRDCMRRGHTPEGMRAVIERGKRIEEITASERSR
ncbi:MAG: hypothetical protein L0211_15345 [Planctomycetaceae bacterium]|nr:hypothetical protein [Planctomycetaceae bacterium]